MVRILDFHCYGLGSISKSLVRELRSCKLQGLAKKKKSVLMCLYFGHLMQGADSFAKTLMLVKIEGRRRRGRQRMR